MALSQIVWSLDDKQPLPPATLENEAELETLLAAHIELLNPSWLVVGRQVILPSGKRIDLLCMDQDGDLIVVELKKDMTPREVTAQVIDYAASVSIFTPAVIADTYLEYAKKYLCLEQSLDNAFQQKYGVPLDEGIINQQNVKMIIVATSMDSSTERIITYLRNAYMVDINILFFQIFACDGKRLISRAWFAEDAEETPAPAAATGKWNGEYYVSFGEDFRCWEDAVQYGFISGGGGSWYSKTLNMLESGDRVWVNIPQTGFVGVGIVEAPAMLAKDVHFLVNGEEQTLAQLPVKGKYLENSDDPEKAEYMVKVRWLKTVPVRQAVKETGFFGNQNTVCRPQTDKWNFTIKRLKEIWHIED